MAWTALRSRGNVTSCALTCAWYDIRTGNYVNINSLNPCWLVGDGDAVQFNFRSDDTAACATVGGSNDIVRSAAQHFICASDCGKMERTHSCTIV